MSQYGFVYILGNEYMPDLIKIGCTERSPRTRADELSNHTGVPAPFHVLCYAEFDGFQAVERNMHEWCAKHRVNSQREFFENCLQWAVSLLWFHPQRLAFTDATAGSQWPTQSDLVQQVCDSSLEQSYFEDMRNPFGKREAEDARAHDLLTRMDRWSAEAKAEDELVTQARIEEASRQKGIAEAGAALLEATGDLQPSAEASEPQMPDVMPWEREEPPLRVVGGTEA